jgi:hypothetical protein
MPRAFLARSLALACAAMLACAAPPATATSVQVSIEVPPGKLKSVRLRHMPRDTLLAVSVSASGRLSIALVSKAQLKSGHAVALFRGTLDEKLSFSLLIPESDDYYLVLDNRRGTETVRDTATVQAKGARKAPSPPGAPKGRLDQTRAAGNPSLSANCAPDRAAQAGTA